ncbi:MAG: sigma-70 family RNA polymerase sigma factor [Bacteroidia bacterium]|nr:sigma-70 family RNA polymerase sigma factor [Bacteroidia bacterium]MDW8347873.1 sigma-70 family RNA polymerase sigma factor [Bacteroidia bacterium]
MQTWSDSALVKAYQEGNQQAFAVLLQRHQKHVFNVIMMIVKDKFIAEDIFQDTFMKVVTLIQNEQYQDEGKFSHWLIRIAYNLSVDYFRKIKKRVTVTDSQNEPLIQENKFIDTQEADTEMLKHEDEHIIAQLLKRLPDEQREVVVLRHYADMSFKEIADMTQSSINTVLSRMRYALINLRKMLSQQELKTLN